MLEYEKDNSWFEALLSTVWIFLQITVSCFVKITAKTIGTKVTSTSFKTQKFDKTQLINCIHNTFQTNNFYKSTVSNSSKSHKIF